MTTPEADERWLRTNVGTFALSEFRLRRDGREWSVLHTDAALSQEDEARVIGDGSARIPYGVAVWPASIALAHEVADRAGKFAERSVLELGAGTGLPGIVAATLGARVVQTDRHELALSLCRRNGRRNGAEKIEYRVADWSTWDDPARYDWIIGADILYGEPWHPDLRRIFASNLSVGGRVLIADPFRSVGFRFLEAMESEGWRVSMNRWDVGEDDEAPRAVGVFELAPPPPSIENLPSNHPR